MWFFVQGGTVWEGADGTSGSTKNQYNRYKNQIYFKKCEPDLYVDTNTVYSVPCVWSRLLILFRKERETPVSFGSEPSVVTTLQPLHHHPQLHMSHIVNPLHRPNTRVHMNRVQTLGFQ